MIDSKAVEMMILSYLALGDGSRPPAVGRANAVPRRAVLDYVRAELRKIKQWDLGELAGHIKEERLSDVEFRKIYANSRAGICACEDGLYLAECKEDVEAAERYLINKYKGILRRIKRIREAYKSFGPYEEQLVLRYDEVEDGGEDVLYEGD